MSGRTLIVVAHPDDETLAFVHVMNAAPDCVVVHVTDGAPLNPQDARNAGFETRDSYAEARRAELACALDQLGGRETRQLGLVDQESWRDLPGLIDSIHSTIRQVRPSIIFTHPYEGGHPDHDSSAFAVAQAVARESASIEVREGAFYNGLDGSFHPGEFVPEESPVTEYPLVPDLWEIKRRMLNCFVSQAGVLGLFHPEIERERAAPEYDFDVAPHAGSLNYERLGWAVSGAEWRKAVRKALGR